MGLKQLIMKISALLASAAPLCALGCGGSGDQDGGGIGSGFVSGGSGDQDGGGIGSGFVFEAKIGGDIVRMESLQDGWFNGMRGRGGTNDGGYFLIQSSVWIQLDLQPPMVEVSLMKQWPSKPSLEDAKSMIAAGAYSYGHRPRDDEEPENGAGVAFVDADGVEWVSDGGSRGQAGSSFEITRVEEVIDGPSLFVVEGTFSCVLYDEAGRSLSAEDGTFRGQIGLRTL
ncbi:hypothetical protein WME91_53400 [Sorangium sp. So ce269]